MRSPYQGVLNIIRFNWHFYVIAIAMVILLWCTAGLFPKPIPVLIYIITTLTFGSVVLSLLVSYYVYDVTGFYNLTWIDPDLKPGMVVNLNAGFDETSYLLKHKFKDAELIVMDFYSQEKHTEVSIRRARKAYPPFPGTRKIETSKIPIEDNVADVIYVLLSAHEIRNETERITFFKELNRVLKPAGHIYVAEHLRDFSNFIVYNIGCFHFFSKKSWQKTFSGANLNLRKEIKHTPFISIFKLEKIGNTL